MFDEIRETKRINDMVFPLEEGQCFYYSKQTLAFSVLKNFAILILGLYLIIQLDYISILGSVSVLFAIYETFNSILPRFLYKKPLFIIYNNSLFCTKNNLVYDLLNSHVIRFKYHRQYFTSNLRIQRLDKTNKFNEELFWIKNTEELIKTICDKKGMNRLPWGSEVPEYFYDLN